MQVRQSYATPDFAVDWLILIALRVLKASITMTISRTQKAGKDAAAALRVWNTVLVAVVLIS